MALFLKLEAVTGSAIEGVAQEMVDTANRIGLAVKVEFNDATLIAWPGRGGTDLIVSGYYRTLSGTHSLVCDA